MTPNDRLEKRRQRTQTRLMDAAEQVFSQIGYKEATILDITEAADVSKRTFYLHFNDKEALIEALALRGLYQLRAQIEAHKDHEEHALETQRVGFQHVVHMIFEYAHLNPDMMQIIFGEDGSYRLQSIVRGFMAAAWDENFRQQCDWKEHAPVPREVLSQAIAGTIFQMLSWWVCSGEPHSTEAMASMCMSVLFDSIEANMIMNMDCDPQQVEEVSAE